jgi:hypothetical protein
MKRSLLVPPKFVSEFGKERTERRGEGVHMAVRHRFLHCDGLAASFSVF